MTQTHTGSGKCLCGTVTFTSTAVKPNLGACHCSMCRQWGGGPFLAVDSGTDVTFTSKDQITTYKSSDWAERGFCSKCGTHLFYRLIDAQLHIMPPGIFDNQDEFIFDHQVCIDNKPDYYTFANKTEDMTCAEMFAKFGAEE